MRGILGAVAGVVTAPLLLVGCFTPEGQAGWRCGQLVNTGAVTLSDCMRDPVATLRAYHSPQGVASRVRVSHDEFQKVTWYRSPKHEPTPSLDYTDATLYLRAWQRPGQPPHHQLYISEKYLGDWRFYDRAHDADGHSLHFIPVDQKVDSCSGRSTSCFLIEEAAIDLPKGYLEARAQAGFRVQLAGKRAKSVYEVPPYLIQGYLAAVTRRGVDRAPRSPARSTR